MAKFNHIDVRGTKKVPSAFGNVFISADSISAAKTVTFPDGYLNGATPEPNLAFKVVFANGHNASNASSYLSLNGVVVVSNQNGTLAPLPIHEMTEGGSTVYKVLDANTALELYYTEDYDGDNHPAFVVVGNPLVLSSSAYSIYANGWNDTDEYSTSEVKTNKVWIDGKPIYRKVIPINNEYYDASSPYKDYLGALTGNEACITTLFLCGFRNGSYIQPSIENASGYALDNLTTLRTTGWAHAMYVNQIVIEYTKVSS